MLIPRKVAHRKQHRPHRTGMATGGTRVAFGEYGIQALEHAYVTNRQIEAAQAALRAAGQRRDRDRDRDRDRPGQAQRRPRRDRPEGRPGADRPERTTAPAAEPPAETTGEG